MVPKVKKNKINFKGKMVNICVDIHKLFWPITALVEGDIVLAVTLAKPKYDSFKHLISRFDVQFVLMDKGSLVPLSRRV